MHRQTVLAIVTILFSAGLSLGAFVVGDIYLSYRAVRTPDPNVEIHNVHMPDDLLGWRPKPGAIGHHRETGSFDVVYKIDTQGFKAVPKRGAPAFRLYFFGDSYTFGHGVKNADTYPNIIAEQYLDDSIQVFNAGVMGYGIVQMYARFLQLEDQLQPGDIVIFAPTSQDIKRNLKDFIFPAKLIFAKRFVNVSRYPYYRDGQLRSVALETPWHTLKAFLLNGRWTKKMFRFVHHALTRPKTTHEAIEMLNAARSCTEQRGARFALFFLPQTKERRRGAYEEEVSAFTFFDVMDFFPSEPAELKKIRFKTDTHWNQAGHAIAARAIVETLLSNGFLAQNHLRTKGEKNRRALSFFQNRKLWSLAQLDLPFGKRGTGVNQIIERINLSPPQAFDGGRFY
jgi:hypothetical protein